MKNECIANNIWTLHILLLICSTFVPFLKFVKWPILVIHFTSVISLLIHWSLNNDACFLTIVECALRNLNEKECKLDSFMHQLVSPIYKISNEQLKPLIFWVTFLVGMISLYRLYIQWDYIKYDIYDIYEKIFGFNRLGGEPTQPYPR